ncbi:MAG TPA: winged helix-turn-helix transcriptional regulator [Archaeoglobus profundus]|nr:winged helix-turn-helix transcriptional regulator [Archaeoglobus profundus]
MVLKKLKREAEFALRHLTILRLVKNNQPIGIFKLSELVNLPKHKVRYSLRVLEQAGIIEPTQHGAKIREDANLNRLKNEIKEIKSIIEELEKKIEEVCK